MQRADFGEITRTWERQRLSVLERSPALHDDIKAAVEQGSRADTILNLIDAALDRVPTPATMIAAATHAFDLLRATLSAGERDAFANLLLRVEKALADPGELKLAMLHLARRHHATALLEATYFDDVRLTAAAG